MSADPDFSLRRIALTAFGPSLLFGLGEGAILPVIPLSAQQLGGSISQAALMVMLIGAGSLLSNLPASWITHHRGERWAIVAAALWCMLAMALCAWTDHLALFALGCFMVGMAQAVFSLARQSYLTEAVPPDFRARALSTLGGAMRIGMFIGPFLAAALLHHIGLAGAYGVGIAALGLAAVIGARTPDLRVSHASTDSGAGPATTVAPTFGATLRRHRSLLLTLGLGVTLVSAVRAARQAVIPLWASHLGLDAATAALIYGVSGGVELLVFYPAGKVMDQQGRRWVAVPSLVLMGVPLLLMPFTQGALSLLITATVIGLGNGIGSGLIMTLGADHAPRLGRAHFLGLWRLMADIGGACGPATLSALAASWSLGAGIAAVGLMALLAAAQLGYWIPRAGQTQPPYTS